MNDPAMPQEPASGSTEDVLEWLSELPSDQMTFSIERVPTPGRTFSGPALQEVTGSISAFVGARVLNRARTMDADTPGPAKMSVSVIVTIDGVSVAPAEGAEPWFAIAVDPTKHTDGKRRNPLT